MSKYGADEQTPITTDNLMYKMAVCGETAIYLFHNHLYF